MRESGPQPANLDSAPVRRIGLEVLPAGEVPELPDLRTDPLGPDLSHAETQASVVIELATGTMLHWTGVYSRIREKLAGRNPFFWTEENRLVGYFGIEAETPEAVEPVVEFTRTLAQLVGGRPVQVGTFHSQPTPGVELPVDF